MEVRHSRYNFSYYFLVDKAETDSEKAFLINAVAPGNLARAAAKSGTYMVQVSTDYVFDGHHFTPYTEADLLNPVSVYACSKSAGEDAVVEEGGKAIIIRTSWLYSSYGQNFVKTILKYGAERDTLNIVFDQTGTPTYARDLAKTILDILPLAMENEKTEVYHYSNEGVTSWYDFAKAIQEFAGFDCKINPITTNDYPLPAVRPFYSVLDKSKITHNEAMTSGTRKQMRKGQQNCKEGWSYASRKQTKNDKQSCKERRSCGSQKQMKKKQPSCNEREI